MSLKAELESSAADLGALSQAQIQKLNTIFMKRAGTPAQRNNLLRLLAVPIPAQNKFRRLHTLIRDRANNAGIVIPPPANPNP